MDEDQLKEEQILKKIDHENIFKILDSFVENDRLCLVMKYYPNTLDDIKNINEVVILNLIFRHLKSY